MRWIRRQQQRDRAVDPQRESKLAMRGKIAIGTHPINQSMALFVASLANVNWQGINPPEAGGDPLVYSATTFTCPAWPPSPVGLPRAQLPDPGWSNANAAGSCSGCPCFDPRLAQSMKRQEHSPISLRAAHRSEALSDCESEAAVWLCPKSRRRSQACLVGMPQVNPVTLRHEASHGCRASSLPEPPLDRKSVV